jgi:hypothetical protein
MVEDFLLCGGRGFSPMSPLCSGAAVPHIG